MKRQMAAMAAAMLVFARRPAVEIIDGVAAIVNDKVITHSEVAVRQPGRPATRRNFSAMI